MKNLQAPAHRWAAIVICLSLLGIAGCGKESDQQAQQQQQPPTAVDVVTLSSGPHDFVTTYPGRVNAYRVAEIRPQVSGIIEKRLFKEGSQVKAGDLLYQIDPSSYEAALASAKGSLAVAKANERSARLLAQRYKKLVSTSAISKQEADDADADWKQAQAQILQDKGEVRSAQINLNRTKIKAPISGIIGRSTITEGALVTDGQSTVLTTIRQLSPVYVDLQLPSDTVLSMKMQPNLPRDVSLELKDGTKLKEKGELQFSEAYADENTDTVNVRVLFQNDKRLLLPGMFARAEVTVDQKENALMAPQRSIIRDPTGATYAMVVTPDNKVEKREVKVGRAIDTQWEILSGLKSGERVVIAGLQKISDGATVNPNETTVAQKNAQ